MYYQSWLGNSPINALRLAGILMILAAFSVYFIQYKHDKEASVVVTGGAGH
jgi:maltose/moltooligosaccharide transporter